MINDINIVICLNFFYSKNLLNISNKKSWFHLLDFSVYLRISSRLGGLHLYEALNYYLRCSSTVWSNTLGFSNANGELYTPGIFFVDDKWCKFLANDLNSNFANYFLYYSAYIAWAFPNYSNDFLNYTFFFSKALSYSFRR